MAAEESLRVACLQFCPGEELEANARTAVRMAREATAAGARLLLLPEYAAVLHASGRVMRESAREEEAHPLLHGLREVARDSGAWILIGSLTVPTDDGRIANRSLLLSGDGAVVARYDKIHMFDATLPNGRTIRESSQYRPGSEAVLAQTPWGALGLTVCYDVRFPYLYRALASAGAVFLAVPSAFTAATGPLHWHTLVRARAIENGCYVFAPATCGVHPGGHATYGHSLIVDPLGQVLVDGGTEPGICYADVQPAESGRARGMLPSLEHTREFTLTRVQATA
ncbi:MAG TPA: carbon-nitrogen hydrolase family protein [Ramlibacter sp.]|nr:carbon-nitrogen hydrolase family protein [Ramlibacter sp.]